MESRLLGSKFEVLLEDTMLNYNSTYCENESTISMERYLGPTQNYCIHGGEGGTKEPRTLIFPKRFILTKEKSEPKEKICCVQSVGSQQQDKANVDSDGSDDGDGSKESSWENSRNIYTIHGLYLNATKESYESTSHKIENQMAGSPRQSVEEGVDFRGNSREPERSRTVVRINDRTWGLAYHSCLNMKALSYSSCTLVVCLLPCPPMMVMDSPSETDLNPQPYGVIRE
ncbi:hypothetical protein STEG23_014710, partial [Scotinomys teguina]